MIKNAKFISLLHPTHYSYCLNAYRYDFADELNDVVGLVCTVGVIGYAATFICFDAVLGRS